MRRTVAALPSQLRAPGDWRTRQDPFAEHREEVQAMLRETPALEAKTVFEILTTKYPDRFVPGQLRTLQRMQLWDCVNDPQQRWVLSGRSGG